MSNLFGAIFCDTLSLIIHAVFDRDLALNFEAD
jgi:hypothetical protein